MYSSALAGFGVEFGGGLVGIGSLRTSSDGLFGTGCSVRFGTGVVGVVEGAAGAGLLVASCVPTCTGLPDPSVTGLPELSVKIPPLVARMLSVDSSFANAAALV